MIEYEMSERIFMEGLPPYATKKKNIETKQITKKENN